MSTYVPLISSGTAGPLGALHLPRLWQKLSLEAAGKLALGYPGCGKGYDAMTLNALGLDEQATKGLRQEQQANLPTVRGLGEVERQERRLRLPSRSTTPQSAV
jgi:hypothetical protein